MFGHRLRHWPNIIPAMVQCLLCLSTRRRQFLQVAASSVVSILILLLYFTRFLQSVIRGFCCLSRPRVKYIERNENIKRDCGGRVGLYQAASVRGGHCFRDSGEILTPPSPLLSESPAVSIVVDHVDKVHCQIRVALIAFISSCRCHTV